MVFIITSLLIAAKMLAMPVPSDNFSTLEVTGAVLALGAAVIGTAALIHPSTRASLIEAVPYARGSGGGATTKVILEDASYMHSLVEDITPYPFGSGAAAAHHVEEVADLAVPNPYVRGGPGPIPHNVNADGSIHV
jgi:hypothetical protein